MPFLCALPMWSRLATNILRGRLPILLTLLVVTVAMASRIDELGIRYKFGGLLPDDDPALVNYEAFLAEFGEEGNVVALGVEDGQLDSIGVFQQWWDLDAALRSVQVPVDSLKPDGTPWTVHVVDSVFGFRTAVELVRQDEPKSFAMQPVFEHRPETQAELDSTLKKLRSMPFYKGFLHTEGGATIQMVYVNAPLFNSENRGQSVELLVAEVERFEQATGVDVHVSGLPYIRTEVTTKIKRELGLFIALAAIVTALLLLRARRRSSAQRRRARAGVGARDRRLHCWHLRPLIGRADDVAAVAAVATSVAAAVTEQEKREGERGRRRGRRS